MTISYWSLLWKNETILVKSKLNCFDGFPFIFSSQKQYLTFEKTSFKLGRKLNFTSENWRKRSKRTDQLKRKKKKILLQSDFGPVLCLGMWILHLKEACTENTKSLNSPIYRFCIKLNIIREVPNFILGNAL